MNTRGIQAFVSASLTAVSVIALEPSSTVAMQPIHRSAYVMGTRIDMTVWATSRDGGMADLDRALAVVEATDQQLSTWRTDSRFAAINAVPLHQPVKIDASTCAVLGEVLGWSRETGGAFDPAVGALIEAWGLRDRPRLPSARALMDARRRSGRRYLDLDTTTCSLTKRAAVLLDAGAFGKGVALDRAAEVLHGRTWQIDFGGQVSVGGLPSTADRSVALAHPRDRQGAVLTLRMTAGSLATSGGSERDAVADGRRVGHILDPRTGEPSPFDGSVAVWHPRGFVADAVSTALFVMGPDAGVIWAAARGIAACFLEVRRDGTVAVRTTAAFSELLGAGQVSHTSHERPVSLPTIAESASAAFARP